jgi:hypothetical protein
MRVEGQKESGMVGERMNGRSTEENIRRKRCEGKYRQECKGMRE